MYEKLPNEIWSKIYSLLDPRDQLSLGSTEKKHYEFYQLEYLTSCPYLSPIQKQLIQMGYPLLDKKKALCGIKNNSEQQDLLNRLKEHNNIRSVMNIVTIKNKKTLQEGIGKTLKEYLVYFSRTLGLEENNVEVRFNALLTKRPPRKGSEKIYNPIYLRIYLEAFIWSVLFDSSSANFESFKKIINLSLLLIRAGDSTGFFCLLRILNNTPDASVTQNCLDYFFNLIVKLDDFKELASKRENILQEIFFRGFPEKLVNNSTFEKSTSFSIATSVVDFYCLFYFPRPTIKLFQHLLRDFGEEGLEHALKSPDLLYVLLSQQKFNLVYKKIYDKKQVNQNIMFLENKIKEHGEDRCLFQLSLIAENENFHNQLPFKEFFNIIESLLSLLITNRNIFENSYWSFDNITKLKPYFEKLKKFPEIVKHWSVDEIILLTNLPENITRVLAECTHRETLFKNVNSVKNLIKLAGFRINEISLLEILTVGDNLTFCEIIFERYKTVESLLDAINSHLSLRTYFCTKNIGLVLKIFPQYLLQLNNLSLYSPYFDTLVCCAKNKESFLLGVELCDRQLTSICEHQGIFNLLNNSTFRQYIKRQKISLKKINLYYALFQFIHDKIGPQHSLLQLIPFEMILKFSELEILNPLLKIKSETLFKWVLFNRIDIPYAHVASSIFVRPLIELEFILKKSGIPPCLDKFGFVLKNQSESSFKHCDSYWYKWFDLQGLNSLEMITVTESTTLLTRICSMDPEFFLLVMDDNQEKSIPVEDKLLNFYTQDFLDVLSSSSHGWLFYLYFDLTNIRELHSDVLINNISSLYFLVQPINKKLFYNLIKSCSGQFNESLNITNLNFKRIPVHYKVDQEKFITLFNELKPFLRKGFTNVANSLLKLFTADEIISLAKRIHPIVHYTYFDLLIEVFNVDLLEGFIKTFHDFFLNADVKINLPNEFVASIDEIVSTLHQKSLEDDLKDKSKHKRKKITSSSERDDEEIALNHKKRTLK